MTATSHLPAWVREVDFSLAIHPQILLTGNVRDLYPVSALGADGGEQLDYVGIGAVLWQVCRARGFDALATLDPVTSRLVLRPDGAAPGVLRGFTGEPVTLDRLAALLEALVAHEGPPTALLLPYTHRLFPAIGLPDPAMLELLGRIEALGHVAEPTVPVVNESTEHLTPFNTIFWMTERQEDIHPAFPFGSAALRLIRVPMPTLSDRHQAARLAMRRSMLADPDPAASPLGVGQLAEVTHGMTIRELFACGDVAVERRLPPDQYEEAARLLRVGVTDDPWSEDALRGKLGEASTTLNKRVLGQERAVRKTLDVLYRSAVGLNGAHVSSSPNRPRGALFLAGPTGVGKTELAKAVASLVLGEGAEPLRFDMSEFRADEAHQRLIGAPPGYVGYDSGGELTNAVRSNPVCVLLFDEIEKAHPRIFDLFLQILEDGRLTDGRGATVHFTECFLIFTSNLGVVERDESGGAKRTLVNPGMDAHQVEEILREAYEQFFNSGIGRPELRNRLGDNYVALQFIDEPTMVKIVDGALEKVRKRVANRLKARLEISDDVRDEIIEQARAKISDGGRGINNVVEAVLVNPLARCLFEQPAAQGSVVQVGRVSHDDASGWQVQVQVS